MPEITIHSRNAGFKKVTPEQRRLMKDFAAWSCDRLLGKKLSEYVSVKVIIDGRLFDKERSYGFAIWEDKPKFGREFTLEVDPSFSFLNVLHTIAHEMVHIKQYAKGELYLTETRGEYDVYVHNKKSVDTKSVDYWEYPWEIEAHGRAIGLVIIWMRDRGHKEKPWAKERMFLESAPPIVESS